MTWAASWYTVVFEVEACVCCFVCFTLHWFGLLVSLHRSGGEENSLPYLKPRPLVLFVAVRRISLTD